MRGWLRSLLFGLVLVPVAAPDLFAHATRIARGEIRLSDDRPQLVLELSAHDLAVALGIDTDLTTPLPPGTFTRAEADLRAYVASRLSLTDGAGTSCPFDGMAVVPGDPLNALTLTVRFACPPGLRALRIDYHLFFDIDREHRFMGNLVYDAETREPFLFDRSLTRLSVDAPDTAGGDIAQGSWAERAWHIFLLGAEHIAIGWDHILFLVALILLDPAIMRLVRSITAFTVAHSLTLALAWFGILTPSPVWVEVLIALSIVVVAMENVINRPFTARWKIAGLFGLVHGLGFYSVLNALELGKTDVVTTLLAFNLGIEAGQIVIMVVLAAPLIYFSGQAWYRPGVRTASGLIACIGLWLVVDRTGVLSL